MVATDQQFLLFYHVLVVVVSCSDVPEYPCTSYKPFVAEAKRSVSYSRGKYESPLCDAAIEEGWYRIQSPVGSDMVTVCPPPDRCGTFNPLWLDGKIPTVQDGKINATICTSGLFGCCENKLSISIKNCGDYRVYYLKQAKGCPEAYCFGSAAILSTSETTIPSTSHPTTSDSHVVTSHKSIKGTTSGMNYPCTENRLVEDDFSRSSEWEIDENDDTRCDSSLEAGWYRFTSAAGNDMVTTCPRPNRCGTRNPVWLAGSLPSYNEGVVQKDVCVATENSCCESKWKINIKNCSFYNVYYLSPTSQCPQSYCFGSKIVLPTTLSATTKTITENEKLSSTTTKRERDIYRNVEQDKQRGHGNRIEEVIIICITVVLVAVVIAVLFYRVHQRRTAKWKIPYEVRFLDTRLEKAGVFNPSYAYGYKTNGSKLVDDKVAHEPYPATYEEIIIPDDKREKF